MSDQPLVCKCGQFTRKMWRDGQFVRECPRAAGHVVSPHVVVEVRSWTGTKRRYHASEDVRATVLPFFLAGERVSRASKTLGINRTAVLKHYRLFTEEGVAS